MDAPVVIATPNLPTPGRPLLFDSRVCNGCNTCASVCPEDVLVPNPVKGKPPILLFPEECTYCGACVDDCNHGGIRLNHPLQQRVRWKRRDTGEHFRLR